MVHPIPHIVNREVRHSILITLLFPGPTILFERYSQDRKTARRYYACSSCRDRKQCGFFQNEGEKVSEAAKQAREDYISKTQPPFSHREYYSR